VVGLHDPGSRQRELAQFGYDEKSVLRDIEASQRFLQSEQRKEWKALMISADALLGGADHLSNLPASQ
jgi:hypothetical protein